MDRAAVTQGAVLAESPEHDARPVAGLRAVFEFRRLDHLLP